MGIDQSDAVGTDQSHLVLAGDPQAFFFQGRPFRTGFAEPARGEDRRPDAPAGHLA